MSLQHLNKDPSTDGHPKETMGTKTKKFSDYPETSGLNPNDVELIRRGTLDHSQPPSPDPGKPKLKKKNEPLNLVNNFSQQKLRAWQPVLTPKWIVSVFLGFGIVFLGLGILLLKTSNGVIECSLEYGDPTTACVDIKACTTITSINIGAEHCVGLNGNDIKPPIYVYYELTNYYQNHRRYVKSRNDDQLRGAVIPNASGLSSCDPIIMSPTNQVYSPCGLIAWSVFNDTFSFFKQGSPISLNENASVIAWSSDVQHKFKNPSATDPNIGAVNQWLNEEIFPGKVENGHFIVWMRSAALPTFRKLYAKIETDISFPITVSIKNRYPVASFGGKKRVVLSTTSWLGGRNNFLGIAYLVIGAWCLIFGIFFIFKNYKNPRILGDVRYLKWVGNKRTR